MSQGGLEDVHGVGVPGVGGSEGYRNFDGPGSPPAGTPDPNAPPGAANSLFVTEEAAKLIEIKKLLDSKPVKDKLEAMKRLVAMFSKGRDVSSVFPDVVKNVVIENMEVKRLVHIYLVHYAEQQPDLALLSVGQFQKNLKDQNQLIRAMSLKVLSSIRVLIISQVITASVRQCVTDPSPYVRKAAAHAIPKVYSLDEDTKDQLVEMIGTLLNDNSTLVLGSAALAFMEVCPENWELVHKNYRKLCHLLVDIDEWAQMSLLTMLSRYCRANFRDPNTGSKTESGAPKERDPNAGFYSDDEKSDKGTAAAENAKEDFYMAEDHRLLLQGALPLLNSRNSGVVLSVAMLFYHCAPELEAQAIGKALVRLVRTHREGQYIVLSNIATMASKRPSIFSGYLKDFFVLSTDASFIRSLKLDIMSQLASEANISVILRELKEYVRSGDVGFVTEAIQAVGRCAMRVREVTESCLEGLMSLLKSKSEQVVAESVVVVKQLLQLHAENHDNVIRHLARMLDQIAIPQARASILWVIGEYCERIPKIAPDVLRKMAQSFPNEDEVTKLQALNLGAKLFITNPAQTAQIFEYVLEMGKYDQNYDIRDRARMMKAVLSSSPAAPAFSPHIRTIFLSKKPAPVVISLSEDRGEYTIASLSHVVNHKAPGYLSLPPWQEKDSDNALRTPDPTTTYVPSSFGGFGSDARGFGSADFPQGVGVPMGGGNSAAFNPRAGITSEIENFFKEEYSYYSDEEGAAPAAGGAGGKKDDDDDYSYYSDDEPSKGKKAPAPAPAAPGFSLMGAFSAPAPAPAVAPKKAKDDDDYSYYSDDDDTPAAARRANGAAPAPAPAIPLAAFTLPAPAPAPASGKSLVDANWGDLLAPSAPAAKQPAKPASGMDSLMGVFGATMGSNMKGINGQPLL